MAQLNSLIVTGNASVAGTLNATVTSINNTQNNGILKFWSGTQKQYDDITTKDSTTVYFITA